MLEGLDVLAGLNVFTLGVVEIRDSECPSSQSCATTESFLLCSVFGWILKPRSLIFVCVCVCVCVTAAVNGFPLTKASCLWNEERQPEKKLDVHCEKPPVRFQLNVCACLPISWALSRKLIYPEGGGGQNTSRWRCHFPLAHSKCRSSDPPCRVEALWGQRVNISYCSEIVGSHSSFQRAERISCCWLFISLQRRELSVCRRAQQTSLSSSYASINCSDVHPISWSFSLVNEVKTRQQRWFAGVSSSFPAGVNDPTLSFFAACRIQTFTACWWRLRWAHAVKQQLITLWNVRIGF